MMKKFLSIILAMSLILSSVNIVLADNALDETEVSEIDEVTSGQAVEVEQFTSDFFYKSDNVRSLNSEVTYITDAIDAFIADSRWRNGASYGTYPARKPYLLKSGYSCGGCRAYVYDFIAYVYGLYGDPAKTGTSYGNNTAEIRRGDVIFTPACTVSGKRYSDHWFVVLGRDGNTLTTAEAGSNRVYVTNTNYKVSGNQIFFDWDGDRNRNFTGYHYGNGGTITPPPVTSSVTVTTTSAQNITETNAVVYGSCSYSGARPSEVGVYFGTSPSNMTIVGRDTITHNKNPFDMWYNLNGKGITLSPGVTCYWQCYAVASGVEYKGEVKSFKTAGGETVPPTISNVHITDINKEGYTVNCTVSDNSKIGKVQFPTWTDQNGQDDLIWYTYSEDVNAPSANIRYRINRSNHNNEAGLYITHIYVYDQVGNLKQDACTAEIVDENEPPVISNISVGNITTNGYTVYCDITDNNKIGKVQFPTWTINNVQDDLIWHTYSENVNSNTVRAGYRVKISEHNNEYGEYMTHIYAFDQSGNQTSATISVTNIQPYYDFVPVNIFEYNKNIYAAYDNALSWTEANELCQSVGGHLAYISDQSENDEITKHLNQGAHYWIGLSDAASEGNFVWGNGENVTYSNWSEANPDNAGGIENYVEIYTENGKWNDNVNESYKNVSLGQTGFILEIENSSIQLAKTEFFKDSKYEFYNIKMPYSVAKFYAEKMGGHIVSINSAEENSFITARLMGTTWLALTDLESEGDFKWTTGEELAYTNWGDGEPNDDHSEDYGTIQADGRWNDIRNQYGNYLVVEYTISSNKKGDINSDGNINIRDAIMTLQMAMNKRQVDMSADFNDDGRVTIRDFIILLQYAMGKIKTI